MQRIKSSIITLALTAILMTLCPITSHASWTDTNTGTNWKRHTAFDGQVRKIMEGPRYVYIWAHQQLYSKANSIKEPNSTPHGAVLYIDKECDTLTVHGLADDFPTSGLDASCVSYNPYQGYLVMAYTNGVIDILTDTGQVHTIRDFDGSNGRLTIKPRNITFDKVTGDAWIATYNGFVRIDAKTFTATDSADWRRNVNSICRVGDHIVAIIDNMIYEAPITSDLHSLDNLTAHPGLATKIHGIMPMSADMFATLTEGKDICLAEISASGDVSISSQISDSGFSGQLITTDSSGNGPVVSGGYINFNYYINDEFENNFIPTRDGYLAFSKTHLYLLKYTPTLQKLEFLRRKFNTNLIPSLARQAASYDFENFWFYDLRRGFYREKADGFNNSTVWTENSPRLQWQGPVSMQAAQMAYSPTKGILCLGVTSTHNRYTEQSPIPILLSAFKDKAWHNYSPTYFTPVFCDSNQEAQKQFNNQRNGIYPYPLRHPFNLIIDPLHPEYVIIGSMFSGAVVMNLNNITGQIMHFSYPTDTYYTKYPGFEAIMPGNNKICPALYPCGTDADGNIWLYFTDTLDSSGNGPGVNMFYWTPDSRKEAMDRQDVAHGGEWKKLFFPYDPSITLPGRRSIGCTLRHPNNQSKLVFYPKGSVQNIIIADHKGSLNDSSDDEVYMIKHYATSTGLLTNNGYINTMVEDPVTGDVIVPVASNLVRFNPNSPVTNNTIEAEIVSITNRDGSTTPVAQNQTIYAISFDEYNRMWIGTSNNGVYGISADRKELIAHYTTDNSPLLSNCINDVCWNPDTQELFIATDGGIMSMNPYTPNTGNGQASPSVEPTLITPDYAGTVRLHNIPAGISIIVEDEKGHQVASLAAPVNSQTVWDTCDYDGNLVPAGIYTFHDLSGLMNDIKVTILR